MFCFFHSIDFFLFFIVKCWNVWFSMVINQSSSSYIFSFFEHIWNLRNRSQQGCQQFLQREVFFIYIKKLYKTKQLESPTNSFFENSLFSLICRHPSINHCELMKAYMLLSNFKKQVSFFWFYRRPPVATEPKTVKTSHRPTQRLSSHTALPATSPTITEVTTAGHDIETLLSHPAVTPDHPWLPCRSVWFDLPTKITLEKRELGVLLCNFLGCTVRKIAKKCLHIKKRSYP